MTWSCLFKTCSVSGSELSEASIDSLLKLNIVLCVCVRVCVHVCVGVCVYSEHAIKRPRPNDMHAAYSSACNSPFSC